MTRAADLHLAATDERQRQVGERREVARRPDAPLLGHDRMDAQAQEVEQPVDEERPAAAVAERERVGPAAGASPGRPRAGTPAPTPAAWLISRFSWSRPASAGGDRGRGQRPEPGRHAVDDGALGDERFDEVARLLHPLAGVDVERGVGPGAGDRLDVGDGQVGAGEDAPAPAARTVRVEVRDLRLSHRAEDSRLCCRRAHPDQSRGPRARLHRQRRHPVPEQPVRRRRLSRRPARDGDRIGDDPAARPS